MASGLRPFGVILNCDYLGPGPPANPTHNNLSTVLKQMGDPAGALREFQLAVKLDPNLPAVRSNLATAQANQ
ncbi:MAG: hypothetical protein EBY17_23035 [Acidobacteriia bacterium]|nr:hypothetical protein [Terriglobia bacterium]